MAAVALITGNGKAGSWKIRGEQLGQALGIPAVPFAKLGRMPTRKEGWVVVVKRTPEEVLQRLRGPWIYDIVDAWPQPSGNEWSRERACEWLQGHLARLNPDAVVFPTTQMRVDSGWRGPCLVLEHHAWPRYSPKAVSPVVHRVGYEGDPAYLGRWRSVIEAECAKRRWEFVVGDLSDCDIGIALRDVGGYAAGAWKSNCKLANLQALGLAALCSPEAGYREFGSGAEWWIETAADVPRAFGGLAHVGPRSRIAEASVNFAPRLTAVAAKYRAWLRTLD